MASDGLRRNSPLNSRKNALLLLFVLATISTIFDQITKFYALERLIEGLENPVLPFLSFTLAFNRGAAFGFLNDAGGWQIIMFSAIAIGVLIYLVFHIWQEVWRIKLVVYAYGFIAGGAVGNVIDRIYLGKVVDFIDVNFAGWHFWIFNIADVSLSIGVAFLVLSVFLDARGNSNTNKVES